MAENWRTDTTAFDYLLHQQKKAAIENRRPSIRKASDLVGPGIGVSAVRVTNFNDVLATFNGYYSGAAGALNAPTPDEPYMGMTVSDDALGGIQTLTGLATGFEYRRSFVRSPTAPEVLAWGAWQGERVPAVTTGFEIHSNIIPANEQIVLQPPRLSFLGNEQTYSVDTESIYFLRQGVYTGYVQVGCNSLNGAGNVYLEMPSLDGPLAIAHLNALLTPTIYLPFTAVCADDAQRLQVSLLHVMSGSTNRFWWRCAINRVGDAV